MTAAADLAARRSAAAHKAWATRRQGGRPSPINDSARAAAHVPNVAELLEHFDREASSERPDWHGVALELRRALLARNSPRLPVVRPPAAPASIVPPSSWADYPLDRVNVLRLRWPSPILVVTFADGEVVRAPAVSLPNKPVNVGRGLRVAIAFYSARRAHRTGVKDLPGTRPAIPEITSCFCEDTGELYKTEQCNVCTAADRAAQLWVGECGGNK